MNWRIVFILLTISIALALLFWRPFATEQRQTPELDPEQLQPDFIAEGLFSRIFSADGELQHRIDSRLMAHYSVIGLTELTEPVYLTTIMRDDQPERWQVTANKGSFYDDQRLILENNVQIQSLTEDNFIQTVETEYLVIDTQRQLISSNQPVLITGRHIVVQGQGLQVDLNAQQLELTKHVKTIYYPKRTDQ